MQLSTDLSLDLYQVKRRLARAPRQRQPL